MPATPRRTKRRRIIKKFPDEEPSQTPTPLRKKLERRSRKLEHDVKLPQTPPTPVSPRQTAARPNPFQPTPTQSTNGTFCHGCRKKLEYHPYILCVECDNVHLCLDCFSVGAYNPPHQWQHPYRVIARCADPLFAEEWSAAEEIKFMDAMFRYGIYQWHHVARAVGTKSRVKCAQHYEDVYLNSPTSPLPDPNAIVVVHPKMPSEHEASDDEFISPKADSIPNGNKKRSSERTLKKSEEDVVAGYLPKRADFDVEFNDGAESIMADLEIGEDDTQEEIDLKMRLVEIYNTRVEDRECIKQFLLDKRLLDFAHLQEKAYHGPKDERDLVERLHVWTRLHSPEEQTATEKALIEEWKKAKELCTVKSWIASGVTSQAEGLMVERNNKEKCIRTKKNFPSSDFPCFGPLPILDVQDLPGVDHLSMVEKELCSALQVTPASFLALKENALEAALKASDSAITSDVQVLRFDPNHLYKAPQVCTLSREEAEMSGYSSIPLLRARRRASIRRTDREVPWKWVKLHGRATRVRARKGSRVDRWDVGGSDDERECHEDFFDEPWFCPGLKYHESSARECAEDYFDKKSLRLQPTASQVSVRLGTASENDVILNCAEEPRAISDPLGLETRFDSRALRRSGSDERDDKNNTAEPLAVPPKKRLFMITSGKPGMTEESLRRAAENFPMEVDRRFIYEDEKFNVHSPEPKSDSEVFHAPGVSFEKDEHHSAIFIVPMSGESEAESHCNAHPGDDVTYFTPGEKPRTPPSTPVSADVDGNKGEGSKRMVDHSHPWDPQLSENQPRAFDRDTASVPLTDSPARSLRSLDSATHSRAKK